MGRLRVRNRRAAEGCVKFLDTVKHRLVVIQHPLIPVAIGRAHHGVHRLLHKRIRDQRHIHVHADEHAQIQIGHKGRGAGKAVDIAAVLRHAVAAVIVKAPAQTVGGHAALRLIGAAVAGINVRGDEQLHQILAHELLAVHLAFVQIEL